MQATFKIYRASHDPERGALILAGKVVKGTIRVGMTAPLKLENHAVTEFGIGEIETVDADRTYLVGLVLTMDGHDAANFLERGGLVGKSVLVTEGDSK